MLCMVNTKLTKNAQMALQCISPSLTMQYYPDIDLSSLTGNTLFIVDLECDGKFQQLFKPHRVASYLIENHLPESIDSICLLVSDVSSKCRLLSYATNLVKAFSAKKREILVKVITDLNYGAIFIEPPSTPEVNWIVWGVEISEYYNLCQGKPRLFNSHNFELYKGCSSKVKLWEGNDITVHFNKKEHIIDKSQCIFEDEDEQYSASYGCK